jgi:hypothetical protein
MASQKKKSVVFHTGDTPAKSDIKLIYEEVLEEKQDV